MSTNTLTQHVSSAVEESGSGFFGAATVSEVAMINGNGNAAMIVSANDGSFSGKQVNAGSDASPAVIQIGLWALLNNASVSLQIDSNSNIITLGAFKG